MHWDIFLCVFNFLWKFEEQKIPKNGMPNFRKFCAKLSFAYWKVLVKCLHHEQFLLNWQFSTFQPPTPCKVGENTGMITKFLYVFRDPFKNIPYLQKKKKKTSTQERTFSSHCWYWTRHPSYQSFLIEKPSIIK